MTTAQDEIPQAGSLVEVRGQRWVVGEESAPGSDDKSTLLILQSVEDGRYGEMTPQPGQFPPHVQFGYRVEPRASPSTPQFCGPASAATTSNPCGRRSSRCPARHGPRAHRLGQAQ